MGVSPIYLESLKTYEEFAASDSLGSKKPSTSSTCASRWARSRSNRSRSMCSKVAIVRNTRILEVEATLPDARMAQQLAQFLAESTVNLSRSLATEADQDLIRGMSQQEEETRASLERIEANWAAAAFRRAGIRSASRHGEDTAELRGTLEQQALSTEQEIADAADRQKTGSEAEKQEARKESTNASARLDEMRKQLQTIDQQAKEHERLLAQRLTDRDRVASARGAAQAALTAIEARFREARAESGYRGERLRVIDPGVVPERPSAPNMPLNSRWLLCCLGWCYRCFI